MITKKHIDALIDGLILSDIDGDKEDFYYHCLALHRTKFELDEGHLDRLHQVMNSDGIEQRCYQYIFGILGNSKDKDKATVMIIDQLHYSHKEQLKVVQCAIPGLISLAERGGQFASLHLLELLQDNYIHFSRTENTRGLFGIMPEEVIGKILKDMESRNEEMSVPATSALARLAWVDTDVFDIFRKAVSQSDILSDRYYLLVSRFVSEVNVQPSDEIIKWSAENAKSGLELIDYYGQVTLATEALIGRMSIYSKEVRELFIGNIKQLRRSAYYFSVGVDEAKGEFDNDSIRDMFALLLSTKGHEERDSIVSSCSRMGWTDLLLDNYLIEATSGILVRAIAKIKT